MEIYDLVGFHDFCKIEMNETEFSAQITFYTEAPVFYDDRAEPPYDISGYGRKCLASLRLVNKGFNAAASKRLFRELHIGHRYWDSHEIISDQLSRLLELSRSSHATSVKALFVKLPLYWETLTDMDFSLLHIILSDFVAVFPLCLNGLNQMSQLEIRGPSAGGFGWDPSKPPECPKLHSRIASHKF